MAIEAGRVGVKADEVDSLGRIKKIVNHVLLWKNPTPTATQGAVTLNLNDSIYNYDELVLCCKKYSGDGDVGLQNFSLCVNRNSHTFGTVQVTSQSLTYGERNFNIINPKQISLTACTSYDLYGDIDSRTTSSTRLIVMEIYGIKYGRK